MDILDIFAEMERYGQSVAFAEKYDNEDEAVILVKLHKMDNMGNLYIVVIWDINTRSARVWHSDTIFVKAAQVFQNMTNV